MRKPGAGLGSRLYQDLPSVRENAVASLLDGMCFSVMTGLVTPYLGVFAIQLGGSNGLVGWVTALPALVGILTLLPGVAVVERSPRRLPVVLRYSWIYRTGFVLLGLLPFVPGPRALWLVLLVGLMNAPATLAALAWTALMAEIFPPEVRARVFGDRVGLTTLVAVAATAAGGAVQGVLRFPWSMAVLSWTSFVFLVASLVFLSRLREPAAVPRGHVPGLRELWAVAREPGPFSSFLAAGILLQLGLNLPAAVFPILYIRILGLSPAWVGVFGTVSGVFTFLTSRAWARVEARRGPRFVLVMSLLGYAAVIPLYALVRSPYAICALVAEAGVMAAGLNLSLFNGLLAVAPPERRTAAIAVFNAATGLGVFAGPLLGVALLRHMSVLGVFLLAMSVRLLAAALLWERSSDRPLSWPRVPARAARGA